MNKGPLQGVRIADFTQLWAGAFSTALLAIMGAEAIKIESMRRVDPSRTLSITTRQTFGSPDESAIFNDINLNKLSVTIDLSNPKGIELAKRLVKISDIAAQNFRPGVMDRLGLGYDVLKEVKPDIIMLSSSAVGGTGPERFYGGFAPSFAALGGVAELTGYADGEPHAMSGRIDLMSAFTASFAMLAALNHRQRTGEGQHIDLSSTETVAVFVGDALMDYTMNKRIQRRKGNKDDIMAPHNCYRCKGDDKWVSIAIGTDAEWRSFCDAIGNPDWTRDERFADAYSRKGNEDELDRLVSQWTMEHTHYEVMEILQRAGVACGPSANPAEIATDPHLKERDFFVEIDHPEMGKGVYGRLPLRIDGAHIGNYSPAPLLGEHNGYVFGELLGIPQGEIDRLIEEETIY